MSHAGDFDPNDPMCVFVPSIHQFSHSEGKSSQVTDPFPIRAPCCPCCATARHSNQRVTAAVLQSPEAPVATMDVGDVVDVFLMGKHTGQWICDLWDTE